MRRFLESYKDNKPILNKCSIFWFKVVILISIIIRVFLVFNTDGTYDVEIWEHHANQIEKIGLIDYYKTSFNEPIAKFNHPPFAGLVSSLILFLSRNLHLSFKIIFRLPFAIMDFLTAFYLLRIFANNKNKYIYTSFYLLNPITFIMSAYHGNTDSAVGLVILATVYYISQNKYLLAGLIFGFGGWLKWIIILACPVLFFALPDFKKKVKFFVTAACTFSISYCSMLFLVPEVLFNSVFQYGGLLITTKAGFIWGIIIFYQYFIDLYSKLFIFPMVESLDKLFYWYFTHERVIIAIVIISYSWLRRYRSSAIDINKTIGEVFCIFYGLTNHWSFQYLAWSTPFWVFLELPFAIFILISTTGYIYLLYSLVCSSWFLVGKWDFAAHPYLSKPILFFRDFSVSVFLGSSLYFFVTAALEKLNFFKSKQIVRILIYPKHTK